MTSERPVVLFVDDEPEWTTAYRLELELAGYDLANCFSADQTLQWIAAQKRPPAVVVLDIIMQPGEAYTMEETKDGLETGFLLFRDIRARFPSVPVVILTSLKTEEVQTELGKDIVVLEKSASVPPAAFREEVDHLARPPK